MFVAAGLLTLGLALIAAAVKGVSLVDLFAGKSAPPPSDPFASSPRLSSDLPAGGSTNTGSAGVFKGPNAALLNNLSKTAVSQFHLHIGSTCRSAAENAAVGGAPQSDHLQCRAFDSSGAASDMAAFARYAKNTPGVTKVFYDPLGWSAPGYDHSDHVHVSA